MIHAGEARRYGALWVQRYYRVPKKRKKGLVKGRIDLTASCGFPIGWHFFDLLSYILVFSFGLKDLFGGWLVNHCLFKGARYR